jgi:serine/threonine-protein kinase
MQRRAARPRLLRRGAVTTLALALAVATGVLVARLPNAPPCRSAAPEWATAWNGDRRAAVERAIEATGLSYAHATAARVLELLDRYGAEWVRAHERACVATHERHEQSAEVLDLRMDCLRTRREGADALARLFENADESVLPRAIAAAEALPSPRDCDNVAWLRATVRPPAGGDTRAQVASLRERLTNVRALELAGKFNAAKESALALLPEAERTGYVPVEAEVLHLVGRIHGEMEDVREAERYLGRALEAAGASGHFEIAARATTDLAFYVGYRGSRYERGLEWVRYARTAIERLGSDEELEAQRLDRLGTLLWAQGHLEEALEPLESARALFERRFGAGNAWVSDTMEAIALVRMDQGFAAQAVDIMGNVVREREKTLGADHPDLAINLNNYGHALWKAGRLSEARAALERAVAVVARSLGPEHLRMIFPLATLGEVLLDQHDVNESVARLRRAERLLARYELNGTPDEARLITDIGHAIV